MAKTYYAIVAACFFVLLSAMQVNAQSFHQLDNVPHDISYYRESRVTPPLVKVLYGRPSKQNAVVFGELIPYGEVWRTGYNEATEVKFYEDVQFGDKTVIAGTYTLLTIPGEDEWTVILNSQLDILGGFQYNATFNVAEISVPVSRAEDLETFSIAFKKQEDRIDMVLGWDVTRVAIPLTFTKGKTELAYGKTDHP